MDVSMEETSYVGLQRFCKISKHILPSAYTEGRSGSELLVSVLSFQTNHLGETSLIQTAPLVACLGTLLKTEL